MWNGHTWLWAIGEDGREGWVPDSLVEGAKPSEQVAKFDYSAIELTCELDETLTRHKSTHGWSWCVNDRGDQGWVPNDNLAQA